MSTLTDRYITATLTRLPDAKRADIERELRASIADAVDDRLTAGEEPATAEYAVLSELGDPARLAAGYADRPQHLIGSAYYFDYIRLLTTLGVVVVPIVAVAVALAKALNAAAFGTVVGATVGATLTTAVHLFFWVTLAFVAIERGTVRNPLPNRTWTPDALPDDPPGRQTRFGELVAVTVVAVGFVAALLISPLVSSQRGAGDRPIRPLDPWLWESGAIYAFIALVLVGLATRYVRYYLRWSPITALVAVLVDLAAAAALIWVGATAHLVSPAFATAAGWGPVTVDWAHRGIMIAGAVVAVTSIVDACTSYRRRGIDGTGA